MRVVIEWAHAQVFSRSDRTPRRALESCTRHRVAYEGCYLTLAEGRALSSGSPEGKSRQAESGPACRPDRPRPYRDRVAGLFEGRVAADVNQVAAPIFCVGLLIMTGGLRFLRAEADRLDLSGGYAHQHQRALDRVRTALPKRKVVLTAAALVAVTLDAQLDFFVREQKLAVRLHDRQI